jgi:twitching motility protein PilI
MSGNDATEILQQLQAIERRSRENAVGLPQELEVRERWEGVVFRVASSNVVVSLGDVREILNYPNVVTRVPGTRSWVSGIANIRGTLLPIIDLQAYLGGEPVVTGPRSRVLVVSHQGGNTGLLVESVAGLRNFAVEDQSDWRPSDQTLVGFVRQAFNDGGSPLGVFDMGALSANSEFQAAAK